MIESRELLVRSRGPALSIAAKVATMPLGTLAVIFLARWLGPTEYGLYAVGLSIATVMNCFSMGGLDQVYLQRRLTSELFGRYVMLFQCAYIMASVIVAFSVPDLAIETRLCVTISSISFAFISVSCIPIVRAQHDLRFANKAINESLAKTVAVFPLLIGTLALPAVAALGAIVVAVGSLLSAAVSFALFKKTMVASVDAEKNASSFWRSVRMGLPYGTSSAIFAVSRQTPLLILALTAVATEVANFRVAVSVYAAAQIVAVAINHEVLRPRLYAKRDGWPQILKITFGLNIVIGLVSLVLFHWGADKICLILFGNDFRESGRVLAILAFAVPLFFVSAWCDTIIIAASGARSVLIRLLAGLLIGMILALLLSKNGAVGVAVSIPISEFVSLLLISRPVVQLIRNLSKNGVIIRKMECQ